MLRLVVNELSPEMEQRLTRMISDVRALRTLDASEIRSVYDTVERIRDALSRILDKTDDKHV